MALFTVKEKEKSDDWKWSFSDYPKEKNGLKVFSCFSCGGGSTMGYNGICDIWNDLRDGLMLRYPQYEMVIQAFKLYNK